MPRVVAALMIGFSLSALCGEMFAQSVPAVEVPALPAGSWRFIVSGDSRNCGDIVMPAIAAHSAQFAPAFYWHLGDLRAIYKIDEDLAFANINNGKVPSCDTYERIAWNDFVANQIGWIA